MTRITLLILFGATFLPGFLSDPFDPRTAYTVDKSDYNFKETDHSIISYEISPLPSHHLRKKRQVTVSLPPHEQSTPESVLNNGGIGNKKPTDSKNPHVWLNLTQHGTGSTLDTAPNQDSNNTPANGNTLLRNAANIFTTQSNISASTEQPKEGTQVPLGNDSLYPNSPTPMSIDIPTYPEVPDLKKHNITNQVEDNFIYYTAKYVAPPEGSRFWIDSTKYAGIKHDMLSDAHRRAATLKPKFEFLFYGHSIQNLTVATGGFIYLGDQVHAWLAATQYVAPLMANFDSSNSKNSTITYISTDKFFTVEWNELRLHDSPEKGNFSFQTTLYKNGTVVFAYKGIPVPVNEINDTNHPVKVGLSDAYIRDRSLLVIKQKTIYEYHRIDLKDKQDQISNGSAIIFTLQDTCLSYKTCEDCTSAVTVFDCLWCPKLRKCSSGMDRNRQDWLQNNCDKEHASVKDANECQTVTYHYNSTPSTFHDDKFDDPHHPFPDHSQEQYRPETSQVQKTKTVDTGGTGAGGVMAIMFFVIIVFAAVGWLAYAYFYPHTPSGQFLIRYRPTQWAFRRGEARYTAASIHM